jgi:hypothetical protein
MRNNIDKETYDWLFKIIGFFAFLLSIISISLLLGLKNFDEQTLNISTALLFVLIGIGLYIRIEYLKLYNVNVYKTRRVPLWVSASVAFVAGLFRLF